MTDITKNHYQSYLQIKERKLGTWLRISKQAIEIRIRISIEIQCDGMMGY